MLYDEDFIYENCMDIDIDKAEDALGNPHVYDDCIDDGCDDGSYIMKRCFDEDDNGNRLILYYNSEDRLVHDYRICG